MENGVSMRDARDGDAQDMVDCFCDAFVDDPGLCWIWPDRDERIARLPHFFAPIVGGTLHHGTALFASDGNAVSLWRQPGAITPTAEEMAPWLGSMALAFDGESGARSRLMGEVTKRFQPIDRDWWYLQFIGVRPSAQGGGLGGKAARSGIVRAAEQGLPVFVEVMNPDNLGYYRHLGFESLVEYDIPQGGPHVWAMLRQVQA